MAPCGGTLVRGFPQGLSTIQPCLDAPRQMEQLFAIPFNDGLDYMSLQIPAQMFCRSGVSSTCLCKKCEGVVLPILVHSVEDGIDGPVEACDIDKTDHGPGAAPGLTRQFRRELRADSRNHRVGRGLPAKRRHTLQRLLRWTVLRYAESPYPEAGLPAPASSSHIGDKVP